jgi:hypothetical protein
MNIQNNAAIRAAYEQVIVSLLNIAPDIEEDDADMFINAMTDLIFATMQAQLNEEIQDDTANHH